MSQTPTSTTDCASAHLAIERAIELTRGIRRHTWAELTRGELRRVESARRAKEVFGR